MLTLAELRPYLQNERMAVGLPSKAYRQHRDRPALCADEAVYVGDQHTDAQAAEAAKMPFVGIGPAGATARHSIETLEDLPALVEAIGSVV